MSSQADTLTWATNEPTAMMHVSWSDIQAYAHAYHIQMLDAAAREKIQLFQTFPYGVLPEFDTPLE